MGILDSGSAPPTYVEPGEDRIKQGMFGLEMAKPFNQAFANGLKTGEERRQFDLKMGEEKRQFDLGQSLRDAKLRAENAQVRSAEAKAQLDSFEAQHAADWESGKAKALQFEKEIGPNYTPENKIKFIDWVQKNDPKLSGTKWFQGMEKNFDAWGELEQRKKLEMEKIVKEYDLRGQLYDKKELLDKRNAEWTSDYKAATKLGIQVYDENGHEIAGWRDKYREAAYDKSTPKYEKTMKEIEDMHPYMPLAEKERVKAQLMIDPRSVNMPETDFKTVKADDEAASGMDAQLKKIEAFNAKYGENAFDKFTGPIDSRISKLRTKSGINVSEGDAMEARQIESGIALAAQGFKKGNYGTALSEGERTDFRTIVETPESAAYLPTVKAFRDNLRGSVGRRIQNYPWSPNVSPEMKRRNGVKDPGQSSTSGTNAAPKIKSINRIE